MATLLLRESDTVRAIPLAAATLVGRAPACLVRVAHESCPAHWLELRWRPQGWSWRALTAPDRTYGGGTFVGDGWRSLDAREGQGTRVRLSGTNVHVELVEGGPPRPFAWDVIADGPVDGDALAEVAEIRGDLLLPLTAEGDSDAALKDGQAWVHVGTGGEMRTFRAHVPGTVPPTLAPRLDLGRPGVSVEIDMEHLSALFFQGDVSASVRGECVRVLAVFAQARGHGDGWLDASEAWGRWTELGGTRETSIDRMSWERGKLRGQLARQHVSGLEGLFVLRKFGTFVKTRLATELEVSFMGG